MLYLKLLKKTTKEKPILKLTIGFQTLNQEGEYEEVFGKHFSWALIKNEQFQSRKKRNKSFLTWQSLF